MIRSTPTNLDEVWSACGRFVRLRRVGIHLDITSGVSAQWESVRSQSLFLAVWMILAIGTGLSRYLRRVPFHYRVPIISCDYVAIEMPVMS